MQSRCLELRRSMHGLSRALPFKCLEPNKTRSARGDHNSRLESKLQLSGSRQTNVTNKLTPQGYNVAFSHDGEGM
jgi:hypothetical protein